MSKVHHELTPLSDKDCFYIVERYKSEFLFPIHVHDDCELNFIENGEGVRRIVGDSVETIGNYELTLVAGKDLEHAWEQGSCHNTDVREITIQFSGDLFGSELLSRNQFARINALLVKAGRGVNFSMNAIMKIYPYLDTLPRMTDRFEQFLSFLKILDILSRDDGMRELSSVSFARAGRPEQSRRINKLKEYISSHYSEDIRLDHLAEMVGMTSPSLSRFFKQHTAKTPMEYLADIRLGAASRLLVDTSQSISEICYACGFNNVSNFNRTFKAKRGHTPHEFRMLYKKNRVFV